MLFGWSLGWLIANGWSLDRHRLCGNPALLRIRLVVLFAALVGLLDGWSVGCLWLFGWLLMVVCLLDCWMVGWLVLRETSVVWTMAICHSSVTERSPQPHYCRQAMPTFFPASAFTILLALLNC